MDTVVKVFLGIPTGNLKRVTQTDCNASDVRSDDSEEDDFVLASAFEKHLASRTGFLGVTQGFYGIYEAQARGALHMHALV